MLWEQTGKAQRKNKKCQKCGETPCDEVCYDGEKKSIVIQPRSLDGFTVRSSLNFNIVRGSEEEREEQWRRVFSYFSSFAQLHKPREVSFKGGLIHSTLTGLTLQRFTLLVFSPYLIREALQKKLWQDLEFGINQSDPLPNLKQKLFGCSLCS